MYAIEISNRQTRLPVDEGRIRSAISAVLEGEGIEWATISVAVVDDPEIHEVNRAFLNHDEPTDVISFVLDACERSLEGELVVSADTAASTALRLGCLPEDEMLLYVVHGSLHLAGYDDLNDHDAGEMRAAERRYLSLFGVEPQWPLDCGGGTSG